MEIRVSEKHIDVCDATYADVRALLNRLKRAGARVEMAPLQDVDDGTWFAAVVLPEDPHSRARIHYIALRAVAKLMGCKIFLDVYSRHQYLRIKGERAHEPALAVLAYRVVGSDMKRIRSYTNHPNYGQRFPGVVEPALSLSLTGLGIIKAR